LGSAGYSDKKQQASQPANIQQLFLTRFSGSPGKTLFVTFYSEFRRKITRMD
jgi:hypothetical protein